MILAVALSNAVLPAAAWYSLFICFRFSLGERKTKTDEKGLDVQAKMEYYHFDVNVKVVQGL